MLAWEVILTADSKQNLTDPAIYPEWYHALFGWKPSIRVEGDSVVSEERGEDVPKPLGLLVFQAAWETPDDRLWCSPIREIWEQSIRTLRFAARYVRNAKTRNPGIEGTSASAIWRDYLGRLRIEMRFNEKGKFSRYQLVATPGSVFAKGQGLWNQLDPKQRELTKSIDALFQSCFSSLVDGIRSPHFCSECGRELPATTKKGRVSRATVCQTCSLKRWKENKGQDAVREQWKKNKQDERDNAKK